MEWIIGLMTLYIAYMQYELARQSENRTSNESLREVRILVYKTAYDLICRWGRDGKVGPKDDCWRACQAQITNADVFFGDEISEYILDIMRRCQDDNNALEQGKHLRYELKNKFKKYFVNL